MKDNQHDFSPRAGESPYDFHKRQAAELLSHYLECPGGKLEDDCKDEIAELVEHVAAMAVHAIADDVTNYVEQAMSGAFSTVARMTSEILIMRGAAWLLKVAAPILRDVARSPEAASSAVDLAAKAAGDVADAATADADVAWSGRYWDSPAEDAVASGELGEVDVAQIRAWMLQDITDTENKLRALGFTVESDTRAGDVFPTITARRKCSDGAELRVLVELGKRRATLNRPRAMYPADTIVAAAVSRWITDLIGANQWTEKIS